jgi:hypothetical protein
MATIRCAYACRLTGVEGGGARPGQSDASPRLSYAAAVRLHGGVAAAGLGAAPPLTLPGSVAAAEPPLNVLRAVSAVDV